MNSDEGEIRSDGRNNENEEGKILTKCNDYRFQCNILYNAVINDANNKKTSDPVSASAIWELVRMSRYIF